jgi:hypothetical protein
MFKSLRKIYIFCWAHCPLKALSLRPHRTCPNCLECTKARDHSDKLTPNNCPSILKSTSLSYWKGWSNKVCPQGFHKIPGNSLLARMDRVPQAKIPCSQRIEQNYIKWCINSFGVGLRKDNYKACLVGEVFPCPMQVLVSKYAQKDCNLGLVWKPGERGVKEVWAVYLDSQTMKSLVFWRGHNIVLGKCTTLNLAIHKLTINFELFELEQDWTFNYLKAGKPIWIN